MARVCDKWHRYCKGCGYEAHVNATRTGDYRAKACPECGEEAGWTRDKDRVASGGDA